MGYSSEKQVQILLALLKEYGVRKIVASPGTTNMCFVGSVQDDPYFELYSSVDERSAAYIAVGLAAETGEAVALSCTGSTASRNYIPGLTEAFYRKLPIIAITSSQRLGRVGQNYAQCIDRSAQLADMVRESVVLDVVHTPGDAWDCGIKVNKALHALRKNGGGPVHINLVTSYSGDFSVEELPAVKKIDYISSWADMPNLDEHKRIAILVGVHGPWSKELSTAVEAFCQRYNAVVICNHASNYHGEYGYNPALVNLHQQSQRVDLVIYIGSVSRYRFRMKDANTQMWRVSPDGNICDIEEILTAVFHMDELDFFNYYVSQKSDIIENNYARSWQKGYEAILSRAAEVPFSNMWVAGRLSSRLPSGCKLHLGGSNTARVWNCFPLSNTIDCFSNDGAMGIDGQLSALIGESLASPNRLHFGAIGDLTFFYDMNVLGNRHIANNIRLLVINNGMGAEFKIYTHQCQRAGFGDDALPYMAAAGHFGNKSKDLLRHYATDLGYEYLSASSKEEFNVALERFVCPQLTDKSMVFEVFTDPKDESDANYMMRNTKK